MTNLVEDRAAFVLETRSYLSTEDHTDIVTVLDQLIDWTRREFKEAVPAPPGDQSTVAFTFGDNGPVFWRAYPRRHDGAKIAVLPGLADIMAPEARAALMVVLESVHGAGSMKSGATLQISMLPLSNRQAFERFTLFLRTAGTAALEYLKRSTT